MLRRSIELAIRSVLALILVLAPLAVNNTACFCMWGEPEVPECMK